MTDRPLNALLGLLAAGVTAVSAAVAVKDRPDPAAASGSLTVLATGDVWNEVEPCG